jgi:hypothetical protein
LLASDVCLIAEDVLTAAVLTEAEVFTAEVAGEFGT